MIITVCLLFLAFYFHLGWCWVGVLEHLSEMKFSRKRWWFILLIWPFSMIATDSALEESDDY